VHLHEVGAFSRHAPARGKAAKTQKKQGRRGERSEAEGRRGSETASVQCERFCRVPRVALQSRKVGDVISFGECREEGRGHSARRRKEARNERKKKGKAQDGKRSKSNQQFITTFTRTRDRKCHLFISENRRQLLRCHREGRKKEKMVKRRRRGKVRITSSRRISVSSTLPREGFCR